MITEDNCSLEVSKLLKEKGFDEFYEYEYGVPKVNGGYVLQRFFKSIKNSDLIDEAYTAPTLQMAMNWLREKYNLHIGVLINYQHMPRKYEVHIMHTEKYEDFILNSGTNFNTNKEACEAAIKYCLENLI